MVVCEHGNVRDYCRKRGMMIMCSHHGVIEEYKGVCRVIVTDKDMTESEYYFLKGKMLAKGYELISTKHEDAEMCVSLMTHYAEDELENRKKHAGRCKFGYHRVNGEVVVHEEKMAVVRRIFELRDNGCSLHTIQKDENVHHMDGRELSTSTIQLIIKNRKEYDL